MHGALPCLGIFLCTVVLEVGWVASVRFVNSASLGHLVLSAMGMQAISYFQTLILVEDHVSMFTGILGAGVGMWVGMRVPSVWLRRGRMPSDETAPHDSSGTCACGKSRGG